MGRTGSARRFRRGRNSVS